MMSRSKARTARGFTLVELAVVVVIVGVLAVLAVVGYRKMILSSKMTEATNLVGAFRIAQEDYKAERGTYYSPVTPGFCPAGAGLPDQKVQWDPACAGVTGLPVHADGAVQFKYRTAGGAAWAADPFSITWMNFTSMPAGRPWYLIHAQCDLDGDSSNFTEVVGTSAGGTIFTHNDGL